jgi:3-hydroxyacyl-CoA dehydrogenase
VTGDFHLATQMVGADTSDFFPALDDESKGLEISHSWSQTARRLNDEFEVSVGFVNGKRCLGGFLELMTHCHYLVAVDGASLGMPEVTLPVVPGMEGCHWPFRKTDKANWPKLVEMLLGGKPLKAGDTIGWLADYAGSLDTALDMVAKIVTGGNHGLPARKFETGGLSGLPKETGLPDSGNPATEAARKAILDNVVAACQATAADALEIQAKHSAGFMKSKYCQKGAIGAAFVKTMKV